MRQLKYQDYVQVRVKDRWHPYRVEQITPTAITFVLQVDKDPDPGRFPASFTVKLRDEE